MNSPPQQFPSLSSMISSATHHLNQEPNPKTSTDNGSLQMSFIPSTLWGPVTCSHVWSNTDIRKSLMALFESVCHVRAQHLHLAQPAANKHGIPLHKNRKHAAGWQSNLSDSPGIFKKTIKRSTRPRQHVKSSVIENKSTPLWVLENTSSSHTIFRMTRLRDS